MTTVDDIVAMVRDELGIPVTLEDASRSFDELPGWDSLQLLQLATLLEERAGSLICLPDLLAATNLREVCSVVAGG